MAGKSISPSGVKGVTGAGLSPRRLGTGTLMMLLLVMCRVGSAGAAERAREAVRGLGPQGRPCPRIAERLRTGSSMR
ncbi:hypothetical protein CHIBA101_2075 [Actinomyces sp. Chiba101]|nr:hypothetical protein CHIBA101_2075 [Actinomyces sp. Chiba101]